MDTGPEGYDAATSRSYTGVQGRAPITPSSAQAAAYLAAVTTD